MFRVFGTVSRKSASSRSNTRATKRSFSELDYFKPKYAEYGDDDFVEDDMYDAVESFQRDKGLKEDGVMREDGPTHHQANAELLKRRRKALDPDGSKGLRDSPGLGLESSVGRKATNKPSDVTKVKKALSAVNLYPSQRARINDGKADDDLQYGLDYMGNKYAAGVDNGRVQKGSSAERNLYDIAGGNNVDYLSEALQGRIVKSRSNIRQLAEAAKKAKADKSGVSLGSTLQALLSRMEGAEGQEGKLVAQALTLPSPNYVPKEVRSPDSNKTDDDDPNPNKDLEYDPSVLEQVFGGLFGTAHAAQPESEEKQVDYGAEWRKKNGYTLANASATESVSEAETATPQNENADSTLPELSERKGVEEQLKNHNEKRRKYRKNIDEDGTVINIYDDKNKAISPGNFDKFNKHLDNYTDENGNPLSPAVKRVLQEFWLREFKDNQNEGKEPHEIEVVTGIRQGTLTYGSKSLPEELTVTIDGKEKVISNTEVTFKVLQENPKLWVPIIIANQNNPNDKTNFGKYGGIAKAAEKINDHEIVAAVHDLTVTGHRKTRIRVLQNAINNSLPEGHKKITVDGKLAGAKDTGEITSEAMDALALIAKDEKTKIKLLHEIRKGRIEDAKQNPNMSNAIIGWTNRFNHFTFGYPSPKGN